MAKILIIDDDVDICQLLERFLKRKEHEAVFCTTGKKAVEIMQKEKFELVFCDYRLPDSDGKEMLQKIKALNPQTNVIIITGYSDVKTAVDVIKLGAFDYVTKPLLPEEILMTVNRALHAKPAEVNAENEEAEEVVPKINGHSKAKQKESHANAKRFITGNSKESKFLHKQIELVAPTNYSVIIYGESGTGKESVAYNIHALSQRADKPFVAVDCGALTRELAGSELFGHEKGAFTGALQAKAGQFEVANGGTIFLDEIANLSYDIQVSLLRVIQERKIRRLGSQKEIPIDVRIIVASNEKLHEATATGRFREDLYHRFNEFSINLPSLRERKKDIMEFAAFFLDNTNRELGKNITSFNPEVEKIFLEYKWPGNLRELNNVIKRATLLSNKDEISLETLPPEIVFQSKFNALQDASPDGMRLDMKPQAQHRPMDNHHDLKAVALNAEYEMILEALKKVNFNKSKAAQLLNVDRKTLYNKMKAYNLNQ